ncbi:MAG: hypothetical protein AAFR56_16895, partial [Chloroflexota bacterium]
ISVAFYIIGFTEALLADEIFQQFDPRIISTAVALSFVVIAYVGADFALKIQFFILAILVVALVGFFAGWGSTPDAVPVLTPSFTENVNFWIVFAVFFPAVTGIEVGTSLSGDLKDPGRSIPLGTIASILVTAAIYVLVVVYFAFNSTRGNLITDNLAMQRISLLPQTILAGVWASTLSSALGSVLAAPRTLQAIAGDKVIPSWIGLKLGSKTEPRMAVLITGVIAVVVIWMGNLDFVAPVISMFFLNTYGMVNLSAGIEQLVGNPSYRPRFKVPWYLSIIGALGCYGVMLLINPLATVVAIVASYGIFFYLRRRSIERAWGDVRSGVWISVARFALLELQKMDYHAKNWRPNIMVFTGQPHNRLQLTEMARWLTSGQGIVTFVQFIVSEVDEKHGSDLIDRARRQINKYIEQSGMRAFAEAEIVPDFHHGALSMAQAHGIGGLSSNTVLMGWSRTYEGNVKQIRLMRDLMRLRKSVMFLHYDPEREFGNYKRINLWWQGRGGNEDLMMLLAYIIEEDRAWQNSTIRLMRIINSPDGVEEVASHMNDVLDTVRVSAKPMVIVKEAHKSISETITEYSADADLTIIGMNLPPEDQIKEYAHRLADLVDGVGTVLMVRNAERDQEILK